MTPPKVTLDMLRDCRRCALLHYARAIDAADHPQASGPNALDYAGYAVEQRRAVKAFDGMIVEALRREFGLE